ncbi:MAG: ribose-5-phosphate isomerase RpiA [Pseudomonadota bacterium]|nr:ribose-5-phosphate isomerase RpiA [Pseudomonadota bacterium]
MNADNMKALVGRAALEYVVDGDWLGVGTGSTVDHFIDALAASQKRPRGAVSSSERSSEKLRAHGIRVVDAGEVERLPVYIDGADEIDPQGCMIKGGGAALTREKIVADLATRFVCIADASKQVAVLGRFPLPVEVIAMAVPQLVRRFAAIGGHAVLRAGATTDNGHPLLDVSGLQITDPLALETEIDQWPGVVTVGIFARHKASMALIGSANGVKTQVF